MIRIYASNGAFITRYNGRDYRHIAKYAPMIECDGIEFLMYSVWKDEVADVRRFLKSTRLSFPIMHLDKEIGGTLSEAGMEGRDEAIKIFQRDLDTAEEIGSRKLVVHLWNGPHSDAHFEDILPLFAQMQDMAMRRRMELTAENVTCVKSVCLDHLKKMHTLFPGVHFTYDTKMAELHGENELLAREDYIRLLTDGAISHLHVNDTKLSIGMDRLPIMHIGDGCVKFDRFFSLLKKTGYSGTATVESTSVYEDGSVDIGKLNRSIRIVREMLNKRG